MRDLINGFLTGLAMCAIAWATYEACRVYLGVV